VNPGFTKRIIGLKDEESDAILQLLFKVCPCTCLVDVKILIAYSIFLRVRMCR
jgi:sulfonate dioxygenase